MPQFFKLRFCNLYPALSRSSSSCSPVQLPVPSSPIRFNMAKLTASNKSLKDAKASLVAAHTEEIEGLRADLEVLAQEVATKEAAARNETREGFQNSPDGARSARLHNST
ncbi:DNA-directed RNA polymerase subunit beta' [Striga asiatica]|uniref:DNA-directed RNA polymerase subunit beta n=1 Tax=Striga asiatica TaxID=4170 RepID=A0A5A7RKT9_STRAF|nr:DNA-directed RNA polymerase subunit beta' [Striga asiatica]